MSMNKFGPFTATIAKKITHELSKGGVQFEVEEDKEMLEQLEAEWKERTKSQMTNSRGPSYDPAFVFVSVPETLQPTPLLEGLGLVHHAGEEPDFSKEEYVCPQCDRVVAEEAGFCGTHKVPLVTWSQHIANKREHNGSSAGSHKALIIIAIGVLLFGIWWFATRNN